VCVGRTARKRANYKINGEGALSISTAENTFKVWRSRVMQAMHLIAHPRDHLRLRKVLVRAREKFSLGHQKWSDLKYLRAYLARFLSIEQKRQCLSFHYEYVLRKATSKSARGLLVGKEMVWEKHKEGHIFGIHLTPSSLTDREGELVFNFVLDGQIVYLLTFSIAPAAPFDGTQDTVVFVGGLQGRPGKASEIRLVSKLNDEINAASALFLALKALANCWQINRIVAISAKYQISHDADIYADQRSKIYDAFWKDAGGFASSDLFFTLDASFHRAASDPVSGAHKSRTRRKRVLKEALKKELDERFSRAFEREAPPNHFGRAFESARLTAHSQNSDSRYPSVLKVEARSRTVE
jgi:uncharacterized protein VirK/YbjX